MFGFGEAKEHRDAVYGEHESKLSHEVVAGGAAFEAMKLFEDRQRKNGMSPSTILSPSFMVNMLTFDVAQASPSSTSLPRR